MENKHYPIFNFLDDSTRNCIDVFDVDNCLVKTEAKIKIDNKKTGEIFNVTPEDFNSIKITKNLLLNFDDFNDVKLLSEGYIIEEVFAELKKSILAKKAVSIITARESVELIRNFLLENGVDVNPKFIFTVGGENHPKYTGSIPERKLIAFKELLEMGFNDFTYYDDYIGNLKMAKSFGYEFGIKMKTIFVKRNGKIKKF